MSVSSSTAVMVPADVDAKLDLILRQQGEILRAQTEFVTVVNQIFALIEPLKTNPMVQAMLGGMGRQ